MALAAFSRRICPSAADAEPVATSMLTAARPAARVSRRRLGEPEGAMRSPVRGGGEGRRGRRYLTTGDLPLRTCSVLTVVIAPGLEIVTLSVVPLRRPVLM